MQFGYGCFEIRNDYRLLPLLFFLIDSAGSAKAMIRHPYHLITSPSLSVSCVCVCVCVCEGERDGGGDPLACLRVVSSVTEKPKLEIYEKKDTE